MSTEDQLTKRLDAWVLNLSPTVFVCACYGLAMAKSFDINVFDQDMQELAQIMFEASWLFIPAVILTGGVNYLGMGGRRAKTCATSLYAGLSGALVISLASVLSIDLVISLSIGAAIIVATTFWVYRHVSADGK